MFSGFHLRRTGISHRLTLSFLGGRPGVRWPLILLAETWGYYLSLPIQKPSGRNSKGTVQTKPREGWHVAVHLASMPLVSSDARHFRGLRCPSLSPSRVSWCSWGRLPPGAESGFHVCDIFSKDYRWLALCPHKTNINCVCSSLSLIRTINRVSVASE